VLPAEPLKPITIKEFGAQKLKGFRIEQDKKGIFAHFLDLHFINQVSPHLMV
jgi:hypothetical protein